MADLFDRLRTPRDLADAGMQTAVEHADDIEPGWSERAVEHVREFAHIRHEFLGEDVRVWAHKQGLPYPPKACAWGAVMVRASKDRIIARAGYRTTRIPPQHAKPAVLWESLLIERAAA